jgi:hypothetical protein
MKRPPQCIDCKLADWKRTANGRLHPSGDGRCRWQYPDIRIPVSMYFIGGMSEPSGGFINRKDEWKQCPRYQKVEATPPEGKI